MAGIVHFANYFRLMEEAEHAFYRSLGLSIVRRGVGWPRVAASCDFKSPLRFGDEAEVRLRVREKGARSIRFEFAVHGPGGTEAARGSITVVSVAVDPASGAMKSVPLPKEFDERIEAAPPGP